MIQILISSHNDDFDLNSTYLRDAWIISTVSEIWFFEGKDRWVHTICYEPTDFFRQKIKFLRQRLKSEKKDPNFLGPLLPILRLTFLEVMWTKSKRTAAFFGMSSLRFNWDFVGVIQDLRDRNPKNFHPT